MARLTGGPSTRDLLEAIRLPATDSAARDAVANLIKRFGPFVFGLTLRYCRQDRALAEDAFQSAFLRFFEAWRANRFADPIRSFPALLVRLARNAAVDLMRSAGSRSMDLDRMLQFVTAPEVCDIERRMTVAALVEDLGHRDQAVLLETIVAGRTAEEAAALLGMSPDAVRQRKSRALSKLRRRLEVEERAWEQVGEVPTTGGRHK